MDVLLVEDNDEFFSLLKTMIEEKRKVHITRAVSVKETRQLLSENNNYEFAIFDFYLPDGDAFDLLKYIKERAIKLCVLVMTGLGDEALAARCIQEGAHAYLAKGFTTVDSLHGNIDRAFEQFRMDRDHEKTIAKMAEMTTQDALTGLYNRRYMTEVLKEEFGRAQRYGSDLSCLIFDLDYFKLVNDTYGHACGDRVLNRFSEILLKHTRDSDYTFRYGGEEFIMLLPQTDIDGALQAAEKIRNICESETYGCGDQSFQVTVSIGVASIKNNLPELEGDLIAFADKTLYKAKADGRNCIRWE